MQSKKDLIKEMTAIIKEGQRARSQVLLESIIREILVMVASDQPAFEEKCRDLIEILDCKEEYDNS